MKHSDFQQFHADFCAKMLAISKAKSSDYAGMGDNTFDNFMNVEKLGVSSTETGILTRLVDKFSRITCILSKGSHEVKDESVDDTIMDMCNYLIILAGYRKWKSNERA